MLILVSLKYSSKLRHVEYNDGKYHGYVDIGAETTDDSAPVAEDALVLMAVSLNESWKIPIAYFLVDGLTGEERANILKKAYSML